MLEHYTPNPMQFDDINRARSVILESQNDVLTIAQVLGEYIIAASGAYGAGIVEKEIVANWVKYSWKKYGTRLIGHEVASAASAVFLGFELASILYGLDGFFENYLLADGTITYFQAATDWRTSIEQRRISSESVLDGAELEDYQAAVMLRQITATRLMLHYANGINSVLSKGWLDQLNKAFYGRSNNWDIYKKPYYNQIKNCEDNIENSIGHPKSVDYIIAFI
jgi:hypothetical protein